MIHSKQNENQLATVCASVRSMQALAQHVPIVLFVIDSAGCFRACEGRLVQYFAHSSAEMIDRSVAEVTRNNPDILANVQRALQGDAFNALVTTRGLSFETHYEPIHDSQDVIHGVIGMAVNITRRVQTEAALDQLRQQIAAQATGLLNVVQQPTSAPAVVVAPPPLPDDIEEAAAINDLTDREQTVLRGVVGGKTNQQIAQELHISPKTVAKHLSSVYAKLGVASRTEAATLAVRAGMVE